MKNIENILIPETAADLKISHLINYLEAINEGESDSMIQMRVLGLGLEEASTYFKILDTSGITKNWLIDCFEKLGKAVNSVTDLKIGGVSFASKWDIFSKCNTGAVNELLEVASKDIFEQITISSELNTLSFPVSESVKAATIAAENNLSYAYLKAIPRLLAIIVLGARGETMDDLDAMEAEVANESLAKLLKIESCFFLSRQRGIILKHDKTSQLAAYLELLPTWELQRNSFGLNQRTWYQMLELIS